MIEQQAWCWLRPEPCTYPDCTHSDDCIVAAQVRRYQKNHPDVLKLRNLELKPIDWKNMREKAGEAREKTRKYAERVRRSQKVSMKTLQTVFD